MPTANYLGIYLAKDHATVVCLAVQGRERSLVGCFSVSAEKPEEHSPGDIARRIADVCTERQIKFVEAAVALDCAMFMQHSIRSEFTDPRKIAQTVRFDTEEALGTDATDVAISFRIDSAYQAGSNISAFTAQKTMLSDLLGALQSNNLDPVSVEPDVNCLARFVCQNVSLAPNAHPLFMFLSRRNGYFVSPAASPWQGISPTPATSMRTFLLSASQNKTETLARQVSMTTAMLQTAGAVNQLEIFDAADSLNYDELAAKLSIPANRVDLTAITKVSPENLTDCPDSAEFAIAYGAALAHLDLPASTNFRVDFMPYQGRKMRLQKTLKYSCVAAVILMFVLGLYGFMQAIQVNRYRTQLRAKFAKEYSAVMFGEKVQGKLKNSADKLGRALRRVKEAQKGYSVTGEQAVSAKFALVLQAFNKCAATTGLKVESVAITDKAITIAGESPSPENSLRIFDALKQTGFNILQQRIATDAGKSSFSVTIEPKQQAGGSQ